MKIKVIACLILTLILTLPTNAVAQIDVNRDKYPDYNDCVNPDYTMLQTAATHNGLLRNVEARSTRPAYINNAEKKFFPPVFNQDGGSCGSASRICYMFTYELNAYRDLDGKQYENYYPSHFVWLLTNSSSGKNEFVTSVGVPSAATYGGQTYSYKFGNQDCSDNYFGWMQGYDKWFEAMHNRMLAPVNTPLNVGTEEGRELVKNWLWNHNGDTSFKAGGVCGIGVASDGGNYEAKIPNTTANSNAGVVGKKYVKSWGTQVDHALTIVGYDDRIEFDLDGNGIAGEKSKDEVGAWIVVNSWGNSWGNNGFIYCPYAYGGSTFNSSGNFSGNWWQPELYKVRKDYRPLRTIKLEMSYSRRSEIKLSAGISSDINSDTPERVIDFEHFRYAGDGNYGNTRPAPEVPMLGKWDDGKMHTEPMEFGYDLTDLTKGYDRSMPLKYFFIVETRDWAAGNGNIHSASIMNYEFDAEGIETPFMLPNGKQEIRNAGNKTIISTIVYGDPYYAPQNPYISNNYLQWSAPLPSTNKVAKYRIYHNDSKIAEVSGNTYSYYIPSSESKEGSFGVSAVYEGNIETEKSSITASIPYESTNKAINLQVSGIRLPDLFNEKHEEVTIEYYIRPNSLKNWNQIIGPGWGTFLMHANSDGTFSAGWNSGDNNSFKTSTSILRTGTWTHIALVIKGSKMTLYANGVEKGSCTSSSYSGLGSFGNLEFRGENDAYNTNNDAQYDEIRIWNIARSANDIKDSYATQYSGTLSPKGLIAYYKGDIINVNGKDMLHEYISSKHGEFINGNYSSVTSNMSLNGSTSPSVNINTISGNVYVGTPVKLSATYNSVVSNLKWTVADAGISNLAVAEPLVTFKTSGYQKITVVAESGNGGSVTAEKTIYVSPEKDIDASFTASKNNVIMGEKVSFIINNPSFGEMYEWSMTGAEESSVNGQHGYAIFKEPGKQKVTLKVTSLSGKKTATSSIEINVEGSAPVADFEITPAVVHKGERVYLTDKSKYTPVNWNWTIKSDSMQYVINDKDGSFTPKKSGIYSVTLKVSNNIGSNSLTHERAITVCNADSKNGLNFSGRDNAKVTASTTTFPKQSKAFTFEWWMRPDNLQNNCLGIGESESTFLVTTEADGRVNIFIGGKKIRGYAGYIIANEWHHYAIVLTNGYLYMYRDGKWFDSPYVGNANIPSLNTFAIGNDNAKMNGQIDELRIWKRAFSNEELIGVCNTPIENPTADSDLFLYYDFNQSGGNVIDRTSNGNDGVRSGFGPDGDAWGLSKGVFSLSYGEETTKEDVTSLYLTNCHAPYEHSGNLVNTSVSNRFYELTGWTIENAKKSGNVTTGAHVDAQKDYFMTFTSDWDGFGSIKNHKTYQTVTLPAGKYRFIAKYDNIWEGESGNSYLIAAYGKGLPDSQDVASSIAYTKMKEYDKKTVFSNEIEFVLKKETEVSLGLNVDLSYKSCLTIKEFILEWEEVENSDEEENTTDVEYTDNINKEGTIYNLQGIKVLNPERGSIYIKEGKKIYVK